MQPNTQRKYALSWTRWREFVLKLNPHVITTASLPDSMFLPAHQSTEHLSRLLAMFINFLFTDLHLSAESVSGTLSGLKYHFKRNFCPVHVFEDSHVQACRHAVFLDPEAYHPPTRRTLPVTFEMVQSIMQHFDKPSLRKRMVGVAVALAFCCLLRPSEYLMSVPGTRTEHYFRAAQVLFERQHPTGPSTFHSADSLPASFTVDQCQSVKLVFLTAKNKRLRSSESLWFSARTGASIDLPTILFDWAKCAHLTASDPFIAFRTPAGNLHHLNYTRLNSILKFTARMFSLDANRYSCHALRVGGATLLRAAGVDAEDIMAMGRWASKPSCLGYQAPSTAAYDALLQILGTPDHFTARDVQLSAVPAEVFPRARPFVPLVPRKNDSSRSPDA